MKKGTKLDLILVYVLGVWSLGLGSRMTYELVTGSGKFLVYGYWWFDFLPLTLIGSIVVIRFFPRVVSVLSD